MEPSELAGMLAREVDAGVAIALGAIDSAGVLEVDRVVARVGSAPEGADVDWAELTWQAEVVMHVVPGRVAANVKGPGHASLTVPEAIAALPVRALLGVGPIRDRFLASIGIRTVGQVASLDSGAVARWAGADGRYAIEIVGRARALPSGWPPEISRVVGSRSILDVALVGPEGLDGGDKAISGIAWEACVRLLGCIELDVLAKLPARGVARN